MKKRFFIFGMITAFLSGAIFTGCKSPNQKVEDAQTEVKDAKEDLQDAKEAANAQEDLDASNDEWKVFKQASETQIKDNETRIAELKAAMKKSGNTLDAAYEKNIDALEQKSKNIRNKMETYAYANNLNNWEAFKREFNKDMDDIGKAFKDLTDNKKN